MTTTETIQTEPKDTIEQELLFIFKRITRHAKEKFRDPSDDRIMKAYLDGARLALEAVSAIKFLN